MSPRCCLFCRLPGHNITCCPDDKILLKYREIRDYVRNLGDTMMQNVTDIGMFKHKLNIISNYVKHKLLSYKKLDLTAVCYRILLFQIKTTSKKNDCVLALKTYFISYYDKYKPNPDPNKIMCKFYPCIEEKEYDDCPICFDGIDKNNLIKTNCNHTICHTCISTLLTRSRKVSCPMCRTNINFLKSYSMEVHKKLTQK